ncbi:MAG: glutamate-1-semialdehyde 2,1-aminomutase [Microbacter sp.]
MNLEKSISAYKEAVKIIPGGVNSPVRAFKSVEGNPLFIQKAEGSKLIDIDNNEFIDYVGSWGPMILGHAYPPIVEAIQRQLLNGTSFGAPTLMETTMAKLITEMVPSIEMVRMVNSGTEATMSAIRLARGYTGKNKIIKFAGCYHGHGDSFLIKAGSGAITLGLPDSPGVPASIAKDTLTAEYNNPDSVQALFDAFADDIAAIIVEPVAANMGVVLPNVEFLKSLRKMATHYHALLIFDEVISGFRLGAGGAQAYYHIMPDLTTLGKIIGGGLPVGAYGGRKEIMELLAPIGPIYQAGTLSGNPLAMSAGIEMLKTLKNNPSIYSSLETKSAQLAEGLKANLKKTGVHGLINRAGSLMTLFFTDLKQVKSFDDVMKSDKKKYALFFHEMLQQGIYLAPSPFEAIFVSHAHSDQDIDRTIDASLKALQKISNV